MRPIRIAVIGLTLLAAACASGGGSGEGGPRRDRNLITSEELIQFSDVGTAYDAIQRLRPAWLRGRGGSSVRVFIDGLDMGDTRILRNYRAMAIRECRFISAADATTRWGTGFSGGVIEIFMR
jgi:hypothetical protein